MRPISDGGDGVILNPHQLHSAVNRPPRRVLSWKRKLFLGLLISGLVLCIPEVVLRICLFEIAVPEPAVVCAWPAADQDMQDLGYFLQPDKDCFYDLRPGARYTYLGTPMDNINSRGFRGPVLAREHPNSVRIACFGDSSTFGMCVSEELTWVRQLEGLLRERNVGRGIETLNAGVIGYTVFQGQRKYRAKVRPYKPDVAVLAFGAINEQLPAVGGTDVERASQWNSAFRMHTNSLAHYAWRLRTVQLLGQGLLEARAQKRQESILRYQLNLAEFTRGESYQPRMSYEEFEQYLLDFVHELRNDGCTPILVQPHRQKSTEQRYPQVVPLSDVIRRIGASEDVPLFDCQELFRRDPDYETAYFADTHHPNATGNRVMAEALAEFLDSNLKQRLRGQVVSHE